MSKVNKADRLFSKLSDNLVIKSIRRGLLYIMPLIMVGAFVLTMLNLPVELTNAAFFDAMSTDWLRAIGISMHKGTFRIMSLSTLIAVSYCLAEELNKTHKADRVDPICAVLTALSCYITFGPAAEFVVDENATGPTGMFGAIAAAIISTWLLRFFYSKRTKRNQTHTFDADMMLLSSLSFILPAFFTVGTFALARLFFSQHFIAELIESFRQGLDALLLQGGDSLLVVLFYNLITHIMWFFGIHGTNVMERFSREVFVSNSDWNVALFEAGAQPVHIVTKEFLDNFVFLGGAGCTLGLLLALFVAGRLSNTNGVAKYSVFPGIFNINESVIYGLPIIFNPYFLVPFVLTPILLSLVSYFAFFTGLVPLTISKVVWTAPIFLSGYISTGSINGVVLQMVNLALSAGIYLPFVRLYERHMIRNNKELFKRLADEYRQAVPENPPRLLSRNDELGMMARSIATELQAQIRGTAAGLHMEYQPQVDLQGQVCGAEALIRWNHSEYGNIPPMVIFGIALESGSLIELGDWTTKSALREAAFWQQKGHQIRVSVNLMPKQINEDAGLAEKISGWIKKYNLAPELVELEITEHAAIGTGESIKDKLRQLRAMGIGIAIDDFGMGSSSLLYLRDLSANCIKLDLSLVHGLKDNLHTREIVSSIFSLSRQLGITVIAEGIETLEHREALAQYGCRIFQGWYYSKSLPLLEFFSNWLDKQ